MNFMVLGVAGAAVLHLKMMTTVVDRADRVFSLLSSTGMSPGEDSPDDRGRGARPLHQIQGDLPQPAHPAGAWGTPEDLWSVLYILLLSLFFHHIKFSFAFWFINYKFSAMTCPLKHIRSAV